MYTLLKPESIRGLSQYLMFSRCNYKIKSNNYQRRRIFILKESISYESRTTMLIIKIFYSFTNIAFVKGSQWPHPDLIYKITEYPTDALSQQNTDSIIARALGVWAEVTPLRFNRHQGNDEADIQVLFASQYHGDGQPFDGEGRILAHAYFPGYGGDAHFDDDEPWTDASSSGLFIKDTYTLLFS